MPEEPGGAPRAAAAAAAGRAWARGAAALGIVAAMTAVLARAADDTRRAVDNLTSARVLRAAAQDTGRYVCLEAAMRARIPAGSLVLDDGGASSPPPLRSHALDYQRIAEELTPGYRFVTTPVPGAFRVRFNAPGPCDGTGVAVSRVPPR